MKFNKSMIFMAMLAVTSMFASCSEGQYWDEYTEEGATYSFNSVSSSLSYKPADTVPSEVTVTVIRKDAGAAETLPVTVEISGTALSAPAEVSFEAGKASAEYVISVGEIATGTTHTAKISFDKELVSVSGNSSYTLTMKKDYTWEAAGSCIMASDWAQTKAEVDIEKAKEYTGGHLYRLVSPYYVLEPNYCPKPGYHVQFYLDESYEPAGLPRLQDIGEASSKGGNYHLFYFADGSYGCAFTREGDVFTINAVWAYGPVDGSYGLYTYATEMFKWTEGCPVK